MSSIRKLVGQTAIYGSSSIIGRFLNFLLTPLYVIQFSNEQYGIITEMYAYVAFLVVLLTYGMETALFRFSNDNKNNFNQIKATARYMIFEEGNVFKPYNNFFKYHSNKQILSEVFYKVDDEFIKEYSYEIVTNNFGLVQSNNINKNQASILFLGDSFIEGQGEYAWINHFEGKFKNFQLINGGILGTGPKQFLNLEKHISKEYLISKVLFFYLGDDLKRAPFNISKKKN